MYAHVCACDVCGIMCTHCIYYECLWSMEYPLVSQSFILSTTCVCRNIFVVAFEAAICSGGPPHTDGDLWPLALGKRSSSLCVGGSCSGASVHFCGMLVLSVMPISSPTRQPHVHVPTLCNSTTCPNCCLISN